LKIVIKTKNVKLNKALEVFIERKFNDLENFSNIFRTEKYFNKFYGKGKPRVEALVGIGRSNMHHKKGPVFFAECQMRLPGKSLRAEAEAKYLKQAITDVKDELQRQLEKYKNKLISKTKRRQRVLKKAIRLSPSTK